MNNEGTISPTFHLRVRKVVVLFLFLAILVGTFFRVSLMVIYPVVVALLFFQLRLRISKVVIGLLILISISLVASFWSGWYLRYKFMSLYYMLPLVVFLFANPGKMYSGVEDIVRTFFKCLAVIAVLNNLVGFIQVIRHPNSDDSFTGIYSTFSISLGGLVILNMVLFGFYFFSWLAAKNKKDLWAALFFLISSIMGFFGGGLIAFMVAFILTFFKPRIISIIKFFFVTLFSLVAAYYVLALVKPNVLAYNISNIKKVFQYDMPTGARKVMAFRNYGVAYSSNVKDFLLGSGPGTFNSRSAFMIGSPSYFTSVSFIKSPNQPYYFKHYAYPLWNEHNTSQALYQDGFRNQPFSSLLSFLGEYGFLFTFFFLLYYYKSYKQIRWTGRNNQSPGFAAYEKLLKFLYIFLAMLFCIDNFFEYAETTLLIVSVIKLIHIHFVNSSPMQEPELVT